MPAAHAAQHHDDQDLNEHIVVKGGRLDIGPCVSIKHALKKQGIKTLKPLISQGFQVSASILVTQDGAVGGIRTLREP